MVDRLSRGPRTLSELAAPLDMSFQAVRKHVNVLENAGVVRSRKVGRERLCRLQPKTLDRTGRWLLSRTELWNRRLDRLQLLTEEE